MCGSDMDASAGTQYRQSEKLLSGHRAWRVSLRYLLADFRQTYRFTVIVSRRVVSFTTFHV